MATKYYQSEKSTWISGEICGIPGIYFSDTCGHAIRKQFSASDFFTRCPTCLQAIRWIRIGARTVKPQAPRA